MYDFIKKRFIKDYQNVKSSTVRAGYGNTAGITGIIANVTLFGLKMFVGLVSGSISVVADAINNLSDAGSSVVTLLGFKLSQRPADAEHPFGHARYEYITGFVVAFIVLAVGILLAKTSIEKIISPKAVESSLLTVAVLAAAIIAKLWLAGLYKNFGKAINSTALKASAADSRNDVIATSAVLVSVAVSMLWRDLYIDGYMGAAVSLFIIFSSIRLIKDTVDPLLGTVPDKGLVDDIYNMVLAHEQILGVHDLMVYNYGPANCFATLHAEVDAKADMLESHDLIDNIERELKEKLNIFAVLHMDPVVTDDEEAKKLRQTVLELLCAKAEGITLHDFRVVRGKTHTNVLFDIVLPFGSRMSASDAVEYLTQQLCKGEVNYYFIIHVETAYV